jgi:hypothetical protein
MWCAENEGLEPALLEWWCEENSAAIVVDVSVMEEKFTILLHS